MLSRELEKLISAGLVVTIPFQEPETKHEDLLRMHKIQNHSNAGQEKNITLIIAEFKDYVFCATHQSLTPEDQLLAVPLIEKALQNVDKSPSLWQAT